MDNDYLIKKPPLQALFLFALPMIIGNLFQQTYTMVDSAIVGRYVSEQALAAVGASYALTNIFICVAIGGGIGASVTGSDCFVVDVQVKPDNVIVVEIDNEEGVDIDRCVALHRFLESKLDRDVEDYELEVGSAGITSPFKVLGQYKKNIGKEVELLTKNGMKLSGILKSADSEKFVVTITKKVKSETSKRKVEVEEDLAFGYDEVKYTKYLIRFK